ncbi:MAG: RlmE family RNA methyltransferase [Pseudomonadota bacterium]
MARKGSSRRWKERQRKDRYVRRRDSADYRSRAAFKLAELDKQNRLFKSGARLIDLGASPGGWSQYAQAAVGPRGTVVAVDILAMEPLEGVSFICGDCRESQVQEAIIAKLAGVPADLVISDMAPNMTGISVTDDGAMMQLAETVQGAAERFLKPGGTLVVKLFESQDAARWVKNLRGAYTQVQRRKPPASRAESREFYVVAKGFGI